MTTYPTYRDWQVAGCPRPYTYDGPQPRNPWELQAGVLVVAAIAARAIDGMVGITYDGGILALYARWHWLPGPALAGGMAAGAGVVTAMVLLRTRLLRRLIRRVRRLPLRIADKKNSA